MKLRAWWFSLARMLGFALIVGLICRVFAPLAHPGMVPLTLSAPPSRRAQPDATVLAPPTTAQSKIVDQIIGNAWDQTTANSIRRALAKGISINAYSSEGETLLVVAARWYGPPNIKGLISLGADPNRRTFAGMTPLEAAINDQHGSIPSVENEEALLRAGADPNLLSSGGGLPLSLAASYQQAAALAPLVEHGAHVNARNSDGTTPLMAAPLRRDEWNFDGIKSESSTSFLLRHGADVHARDRVGRPPLFYAIATTRPAYGGYDEGTSSYSEVFDLDSLKLLLAHGADLRARDHAGLTALHWASLPTISEDEGDGSKHAPLSNRLRVMQFCLAHGLAVDTRDNLGRTPLMFALENYYRSFAPTDVALRPIKFLLAHGADINARDSLGHSVLDRAHREPVITQFLRAHGAH